MGPEEIRKKEINKKQTNKQTNKQANKKKISTRYLWSLDSTLRRLLNNIIRLAYI